MEVNSDVFSLEDYESSQLFITQEPKEKIGEILKENEELMEVCDGDGGHVLGFNEMDFASPCVSLVNRACKLPEYSDISDEEQFEER